MALKMIQPLEITHFSNQKKFLVIEQTESYIYEDGKRGPQDGCKITVFDEKQKEKFVVKVKVLKPPTFALLLTVLPVHK